MLLGLYVARLAVLVATMGIIGCNGTKEFSPEDFRKIEKGMPESEVEVALGRPKESIEAMGVKRSFWQVGEKYYSVSFQDGKVSAPLGPIDRQEYEDLKAFGEHMRRTNQKLQAPK